MVFLVSFDASAERLAVWGIGGSAPTPHLADALRILGEVEAHQEGGRRIFIRVTTDNFAMTDNGTGCVEVAVFEGETLRNSVATCSERNPGKGWPWYSPTRRGGESTHSVPDSPCTTVRARVYNGEYGPRPGWTVLGECPQHF